MHSKTPTMTAREVFASYGVRARLKVRNLKWVDGFSTKVEARQWNSNAAVVSPPARTKAC
jgi:hypothetical protein